MGYGLPEKKSPGKNRLTSNRAKKVRSGGLGGSQADLARNGNPHTPEVMDAREGFDPSKRFPIKKPENGHFED